MVLFGAQAAGAAIWGVVAGVAGRRGAVGLGIMASARLTARLGPLLAGSRIGRRLTRAGHKQALGNATDDTIMEPADPPGARGKP